jgi:sugar lactone lactonase YvrE
VLQALANVTRYPSNRVPELFELADSAVYAPALEAPPTSWLLFVKFTGEFASEYAPTNLMSGPGNVAFDERGFAWINDNYVPTAPLGVAACAGLRLLTFHPWGAPFPGSPYFGGGLSGAGFGISIDPRGRIWVGNFGFEAPACTMLDDPLRKVPATHDSVSAFRPDGSPISGFEGFTDGLMWWPQATVPDRKGNVWVANCGNDTVTLIPNGKPERARNIALPGGQGERGRYRVELPDRPLIKPFAIAIDPRGRAWVTGNRTGHVPGTEGPAGRVYRVSADGSVETLPHRTAEHPDSVLSWPMGISGDSAGNMWVSNSDSVDVPCVTPLNPQDGDGASVVLYPADGGAPQRYVGGGISIPWGNAIDGNDTLWVFNFGHKPTRDVTEDTTWPDTALSHFCGTDESRCPAGKRTGDPISPDTGYVSDALDRITGGGIDLSGNVWLMNNWKKTGPYPPVYQTNPGGNSFVIVPGAAAPVRTPVIGPPVAFDAPGRPHGPPHGPPRAATPDGRHPDKGRRGR